MAEAETSTILTDNFFIYPKRLLYNVNLTSRGITYVKEGDNAGQKLEFLLLDDIIGCHCLKGRNKEDVSGYICVYSYPLKKKIFRETLVRYRLPLTFRIEKTQSFEENQGIAEKWKIAILCLLRGRLISPGDTLEPSMIPPSKKMLMFINPTSGNGKANQIFHERVVAFMAESDIHYKVIITKRPNEARDMMKNLDISEWYAIVIVSGDGLIFEVINGLMSRPDWKTAIKTNIGAIPGGSGNALCASLSHYVGEPYKQNPAFYSSFRLAKGHPVTMDLAVIETQTSRFFSFLSIGWGIMSDIDIESEKYRKIGEIRFTLGALAGVLKLKTYKGSVMYLRAKDYRVSTATKDYLKDKKARTVTSYRSQISSNENDIEFKREFINRSKSCPTQIKSTPIVKEEEEQVIDISDITLKREDEELEIESKRVEDEVSPEIPASCSSADVFESTLPDLFSPVPSAWECIEGEFILVYATLHALISTDVLLAPDAKLDDGIIHLLVVRAGISRSALLTFFLSLENGEHINLPYVEVIPVTAFRIVPSAKEGIMTVDGELVDFGPLQAQILPKVANVLL